MSYLEWLIKYFIIEVLAIFLFFCFFNKKSIESILTSVQIKAGFCGYSQIFSYFQISSLSNNMTLLSPVKLNTKIMSRKILFSNYFCI